MNKNVKIDPIIFRTINNSFQKGRFSHLYIFSASKANYPINEIGFLFMKILEKSKIDISSLHSFDKYIDFYLVDGSKELIKKEKIITAIEKMSEKPFYKGGPKLLLIKNLENANVQSLNSLLKFLEDPTDNSFIIITTENLTSILPTIRSRSQILTIKPKSRKQFIDELESKNYTNIEARIISEITTSVKTAEDYKVDGLTKTKEEIISILDIALNNSRDFFIFFVKIITKNNYLIPLTILKMFYNDIWKYEINDELQISLAATLEKYSSAKFDFAAAITYINEFLSNRFNNINFDLDKNDMLLKLKGLYE